MTDNEMACLRFLADKMEATALMVGDALWKHRGMVTGNLSTSGANVLVALRKRGFVTYLPDLKAWRITAAGRTILAGSAQEG